MPELFVNYVQNGAVDGREAGDISSQLKCASCEPRNYKYFRSANNAPRQSFANGFRHVRLLDGAKRVASPGVRALVRYAVFAGRAGQIYWLAPLRCPAELRSDKKRQLGR